MNQAYEIVLSDIADKISDFKQQLAECEKEYVSLGFCHLDEKTVIYNNAKKIHEKLIELERLYYLLKQSML